MCVYIYIYIYLGGGEDLAHGDDRGTQREKPAHRTSMKCSLFVHSKNKRNTYKCYCKLSCNKTNIAKKSKQAWKSLKMSLPALSSFLRHSTPHE